MDESLTRFHRQDLADDLPVAGSYSSIILGAQLRHSAHGNLMLQVIHSLHDVPPHLQRLPDYFILEGPNKRAVALARRRIVQLFRACGLDPVEGETISTTHLLDARLDVKVIPDTWNGKPWLRPVDYRPGSPTAELTRHPDSLF